MINKNLLRHIEIEKIRLTPDGIGAVRRIRPFVLPGILGYMYNVLVQPHFIYCSVVWGNGDKTLSDRYASKASQPCCSHCCLLQR